MYNGVGVQTVRGTGTNGYVQRNLSHIQCAKMPMPYTQYAAEEDIKKLETMLNREPNKELLQHERKRQIELKCTELEDLMEEQGYKEDEIQEKISEYRKLLTKELEREKKRKDVPEMNEEDENGRQRARDTHGKAILQKRKNDTIKNAFGIGEDYVNGSVFLKIKKAGGALNILPPTVEEKAKMEVEAAEKTEKFEQRYEHDNLAARQPVKEESDSSSSSSDSSDSDSSSEEEEVVKEEPKSVRRPKEDDRRDRRCRESNRDGEEKQDRSESKKVSPPPKSHSSRHEAPRHRQRSSPSPKRTRRERERSNSSDKGDRHRKSSRSPNARRVTSSSRRRDDSRDRRRRH